MNKITKRFLVVGGIVAVLFLCVPILTGVMYTISANRSYTAEPPRQIGALGITNSEISVTLWQKSRPRAISYEGSFCVLQVARRGKDDEYYPLWPWLPGDNPRVSVYWLPGQACIKLVEDGEWSGPQESIIDLPSHQITYSDPATNGYYMYYEPRNAMSNLTFPKASEMWIQSTTRVRVQAPEGAAIHIGVLYQKGPGMGHILHKTDGADGQFL